MPQPEESDRGLSAEPDPQQKTEQARRSSPKQRAAESTPPPPQGIAPSEKKDPPQGFTADAGIYSRTPKEKGPPPRPAWMTAQQGDRYDQLIAEWSEHKELTPGDRQLIAMAACVEIELGKLQQFINEHGPTYLVRGKSGDTYTRARPEYQQLQEARQRLSVLVDKLTSKGPSERSTDAFIAL